MNARGEAELHVVRKRTRVEPLFQPPKALSDGVAWAQVPFLHLLVSNKYAFIDF